MRTTNKAQSRKRDEAKAKLLVGLLGSKTSNNMTRLYCAMREYRTAEGGASHSNSSAATYSSDNS